MCPTRRLELAEVFRGPHIGPDETAAFARRIGFLLAIEFQPAAFGLAGLIQDVALNVEFPAVIEAAQAALLIASEGERSAAVHAAFGEYAEPPLRVAEDDEVFAQHAGADRRAVGFGDFF